MGTPVATLNINFFSSANQRFFDLIIIKTLTCGCDELITRDQS